jgi:hypothetical protein
VLFLSLKKEIIMKVIYADTLEELSVKSLGLHHDHCEHFYFGETIKVPDIYELDIVGKKKFCFIYEEQVPNI